MTKLTVNEAIELGLDELYRRRDEMADSGEIDADLWNTIQSAISHLETQEAAAEERKQATEEQKASFTLPHDYNEIFGDPRANDEIMRLVKSAIDQTSEYYEEQLRARDAEHIRQVQAIHEGYEQDLAEAYLKNDNLRDEIERLNGDIKQLKEENTAVNDNCIYLRQQLEEANAKVKELEERAKDAEQKRDAAAREVDSLKAQIAELEQTVTKPKRNLSITLSSGITEDRPIKSSLQLALEKHGLAVPAIGGGPSGESFQNSNGSQPTGRVDKGGVSQVDGSVPAKAVTFPESTDPAPDVVSESTGGNDQGVGFEAWAKAEIEKLTQRVDRLEASYGKLAS